MWRTTTIALALILTSAAQAQYLAEQRAPKGIEDLFHAGERAYRSGDHQTAITLFTQVLEHDPEHLNAYLQRGFCHGRAGEHEKAVSDFSAVLERKPDHIWAYTSRGAAYNRLGRHQDALEDLNAAIALAPKDGEAYNNRGWAHKGMGDMASACKDWRTSHRAGNAEAKIILTNNRCK